MTSQNPHIPFMQAALAVAEQALPQDVPVGAVLIKKGQIICQAHNRREIDHNPIGHAEILCLEMAGNTLKNWRLSSCTLYVTLEPCPMCLSAILQARIDTLVYGASDPVMGACGSAMNLLPSSGGPKVIQSILETESRAMLKTFFKDRR
ncbi:MAG: nucleoside deaminase [Vampirovibrio sp.]|nr:nucleoside deaminase [Vampirovibrio sp.]